jgi:hypothetical protein
MPPTLGLTPLFLLPKDTSKHEATIIRESKEGERIELALAMGLACESGGGMDVVRMGIMRRTASSWRGSGRSDAFGRSAREEDDEEALRWAAIEKLPTYDRMRKGILTPVAGGGVEEVDIQALGMQERKCDLST